MFAPTVDVVISTSGGAPVTVTVSCTADGAIPMFNTAVWPTRIWTFRFTVVKPDSSALIA